MKFRILKNIYINSYKIVFKIIFDFQKDILKKKNWIFSNFFKKYKKFEFEKIQFKNIKSLFREQGYKSRLSLNEKCIFENISLGMVNMNNGTKKVVNMKILQNLSIECVV